MTRGGWLLCVVACGGAATQAANVTICPPGTVLDPAKHECVAMEGVTPVVTEPTATATATATATGAMTIARTSTSASTSTSTTGGPPPPPPPPPTTGFAVDVKCTFPSGWVSLLPVAKYPKDDQFLMQALIGFTKEPSFWTGLSEYRAIQPFAAKRCNGTAVTRLLAPTAGDYYLLAGQEGTFSARGAYSNNGVRRKITVNASTAVNLAPSDLTHTWLCISCPWIVFRGEGGRDLEPFVVLANRRSRNLRGTDRRRVAHVPVIDGHIALRVVEVENETTHLESLRLFMNGASLGGTRPALRMGPRTQVAMDFVVPNMANGFADVEVEATGWYDPL